MKKSYLIFVLTIFATFSIQTAHASHAAGADLTYTYVSTNTIHLKLRFYRDCSGIPAPITALINISSASCGQNFSINMPLISSSEFLTSECIDTTLASTCNGGNRLGIELYIYEQDVTLPTICTDWIFEFVECMRNGNQTLISNPCLYISTTLDNLNGSYNSSPQFISTAVISFCLGVPAMYVQNGFDSDGDSLVYSLASVQGAGASNVNYIPPYSGTYPISSSTGFNIDQQGVITFTPNKIMVGVICIQVDEYRNGVKIGGVRRDIEIHITNACSINAVPQFNNQISSNGVIVPCNAMEFDVLFNRMVLCNSVISDDFRVINAMGFPVPVVGVNTVSCNGNLTNKVHITLSQPLTWGNNILIIRTGSDGNTVVGNCGFQFPANDSLLLILNDPVHWPVSIDTAGCLFSNFEVVFNDLLYCFTLDHDGSALQLFDAGNNNAVIPVEASYSYCGPSGDDSLSNKILVVIDSLQALTGPLYLLAQQGSDGNSIANSCGNFLNSGDTLAIILIDNYLPVTLPDLTLGCSNSPVLLNTGYNGCNTCITQWYFNGQQLTGAVLSELTANYSGLYSVRIINGTCIGEDSTLVKILEVPAFDLGDDIANCNGDTIRLTMPPGGEFYQWYLNGLAYEMDPTQDEAISEPGEYVGLIVVSDSSGFLCFSSDTIIIRDVPPFISSLNDLLLCSTDLPYTLDAGNSGAHYLWETELNDTLQTLTVNNSGQYTVDISFNHGCVASDSMTLSVIEQAEAPVVNCNISSSINYSSIYSWTSVQDNDGYEVSYDGYYWFPPNTPQGPESHGETYALSNFYVRAITMAPCLESHIGELDNCGLVVPNIITPNRDGQNDQFIILNIDLYPENSLRIYNKWGIIVYEADGYNNTSKVFDGEGLAVDAYFYTLILGNGRKGKSGSLIVSR